MCNTTAKAEAERSTGGESGGYPRCKSHKKRGGYLWIIFLLASATGQAQNRSVPQPPKFENNHGERTYLAVEIPHPIERYSYRTTGTYAGVEYHAESVPLWNFSPARVQVGTLPLGSPVRLQFVRGIGGRNFYGYMQDSPEGQGQIDKIMWIDGRFVEIAGEN